MNVSVQSNMRGPHSTRGDTAKTMMMGIFRAGYLKLQCGLPEPFAGLLYPIQRLLGKNLILKFFASPPFVRAFSIALAHISYFGW